MKKLLSVLIAIFTLLSCVACNSPNSASNSPEKAVNGEKEEFMSAEEITPELIQEKVQGSWDALGQTITFEGNKVSFGGKIEGTFTVSIEESVIKASLVASDGIVSLDMPYTYENGVLKLYNNQNQEVTRK